MDCISLVFKTPFSKFFAFVWAGTCDVKGKIPIFPSKITLPLVANMGWATTHMNMILGINLLDWISLGSISPSDKFKSVVFMQCKIISHQCGLHWTCIWTWMCLSLNLM